MLRELLLRDLKLHRWTWVFAGLMVGPGFFLLFKFLSFDPDARISAIGFVFGLATLITIPFPLALHCRELTLGTFSDLVAMPVSRCEIVHLRLLQGAMAFTACMVFFLLLGSFADHALAHGILAFLRSTVPLWLFIVFLFYPMPFVMRWGVKGVGLCLGLSAILFVLFLGWGLLYIFHHHFVLVRMWERFLDGLSRMSVLQAKVIEFAVIAALTLASYRLSILGLERFDA